MKIVGICGSPHPNGNTAKLIMKVLEGAESVEAETEFISLSRKEISFCGGCYRCLNTGQCVIEDGLNEIRRTMMEAEGVVLGSPTYGRGITGQMKTFFDRLWYDMHRESFLGKHAVCVNSHILTPGTAPGTLRDLTLALGYTVTGAVRSGKLGEVGGRVEEDRHALKAAFEAGVKLVKSIKEGSHPFPQKMIRDIFIRPFFRKVDELFLSSLKERTHEVPPH